MASDSIRFYTAVYVALVALAASMYLFVHTLPFSSGAAVGATLGAATLKSLLVVGYYQHLRWEPRSIKGLMAGALVLVMLLMGAASLSIMELGVV
jgi:cytochrome c oxidase subunit 4